MVMAGLVRVMGASRVGLVVLVAVAQPLSRRASGMASAARVGWWLVAGVRMGLGFSGGRLLSRGFGVVVVVLLVALRYSWLWVIASVWRECLQLASGLET